MIMLVDLDIPLTLCVILFALLYIAGWVFSFYVKSKKAKFSMVMITVCILVITVLWTYGKYALNKGIMILKTRLIKL